MMEGKKTGCPFLVKVFYTLNTQLEIKSLEQLPFLHLHLHFNTTLREVIDLIKVLIPQTRTKQRFRLNKLTTTNEEIVKKEMGTVNTYHQTERDHRTLDTNNFRIGESLYVAAFFK